MFLCCWLNDIIIINGIIIIIIIKLERLTALYPGQPGWADTRTLRNINPIYHPHCPQIPH